MLRRLRRLHRGGRARPRAALRRSAEHPHAAGGRRPAAAAAASAPHSAPRARLGREPRAGARHAGCNEGEREGGGARGARGERSAHGTRTLAARAPAGAAGAVRARGGGLRVRTTAVRVVELNPACVRCYIYGYNTTSLFTFYLTVLACTVYSRRKDTVRASGWGTGLCVRACSKFEHRSVRETGLANSICFSVVP